MAVVVVGGQARKVGKTSVMAGLIAAIPERHWTAMKLTQHWHEGSSTEDAIFSEDHIPGTDSARYLEAGAVRSLWVRAHRPEEAMPRIAEEIAQSESVIIESNSILEFLRPDVFILLTDSHVADFKESAKRYLDRADAVVITGGEPESGPGSAGCFYASQHQWCSPGLVAFVRERLK